MLRDEGEAYGRKLIGAEVEVMTTRYNATIHDFVMLNALAQDVISCEKNSTGVSSRALVAVDSTADSAYSAREYFLRSLVYRSFFPTQ